MNFGCVDLALPGGFFYVKSGLILAADNEAELAGVMSHEIAHVAARHAMRQMTRMQIARLATIGNQPERATAGLRNKIRCCIINFDPHRAQFSRAPDPRY